jgi:spore coat polysaccharide biosynthesis protein SpsF
VSRGSLADVLERLASAVPNGCEAVVRLTGDCPLVDPDLVDHHIARFTERPSPSRYVSNVVERTYPDGLDVEIMSRALLERAERHATTTHDREHVTPWIQRHAEERIAVTQPVDLSDVRWVLDTPEDYHVIAGIYGALHPVKPRFDSLDIYRLQTKRPDLVRLAGSDSVAGALERMRRLLEAGRPE